MTATLFAALLIGAYFAGCLILGFQIGCNVVE